MCKSRLFVFFTLNSQKKSAETVSYFSWLLTEFASSFTLRNRNDLCNTYFCNIPSNHVRANTASSHELLSMFTKLKSERECQAHTQCTYRVHWRWLGDDVKMMLANWMHSTMPIQVQPYANPFVLVQRIWYLRCIVYQTKLQCTIHTIVDSKRKTFTHSIGGEMYRCRPDTYWQHTSNVSILHYNT